MVTLSIQQLNNVTHTLALLGKKGTSYYHADGLGSIVAMTNDRAKIVQRYEYDSFGNLHDRKNRIKQPYTYTGREYDKETGLYYYRARYYDAEVGRFISEDPIGFKSGQINMYSYVGNDPANWIDPYGLKVSIVKLRKIIKNSVSAEDLTVDVASEIAGVKLLPGVPGIVAVPASLAYAIISFQAVESYNEEFMMPKEMNPFIFVPQSEWSKFSDPLFDPYKDPFWSKFIKDNNLMPEPCSDDTKR